MIQSTPLSIPGIILSNQPVINEHFLMRIKLPPDFPTPQPGQFVMIRSRLSPSTLLSRPMSIYSFERGRSAAFLEIFYRVAGEGTAVLSFLKSDSEVVILGPLGNGFDINTIPGRAILISGGIGISPLTFLAAHLSEIRKNTPCQLTAYVGSRHSGLLAGLDRLSGYCSEINICTDDGSQGFPGTVLELFEQDLSTFDAKDSMIYTCGPQGMMIRLAELLMTHPLPCQVSLEERMACGLGACLGCAVPVRSESGQTTYRRVCKDGPVFDIREMVWTSLGD